MAVETPTVLKTYFQTGDKPTQAQFVNLIDSAIPALVYRALLNQTGVAAPTAIVLENTLGEVPTFQYTAVGFYRLVTIGNVFTVAKTYPVIGNLGEDDPADPVNVAFIKRSTNTDILIISKTYDAGAFNFVAMDAILLNTPVEILIYP